jgi:hypothetical protein
MEGLLFFRVYPSDGFRFILIPDGNPSHEFPILDGNPSQSNMNLAIEASTRSQTSVSFVFWDAHTKCLYQVTTCKNSIPQLKEVT